MSDERTIAGRYRLLERVGSGGMGTVSRAFDQTLRRTVAVKEVHVPGGLSGKQNDELVRRTMREGRIAARLHHPQLITVYDVVEDGGRPYLIMEYFPSRSLKALGTMRHPAAAWIGAQAAEALASAHASGVVHRDVKPANILVGDDAAVKITDFGVSRVVEDLTATMTGMFAGTPAYLAPEVAKGGQATFASDVYSLGATLYATIEGTPPAGDSSNPMGLLYRVASGSINKPKNAGELTDVLMWLLSADPAARPTMAQASEALARTASKPSVALLAAPEWRSVPPAEEHDAGTAAESATGPEPEPEPAAAAESATAQAPTGPLPADDAGDEEESDPKAEPAPAAEAAASADTSSASPAADSPAAEPEPAPDPSTDPKAGEGAAAETAVSQPTTDSPTEAKAGQDSADSADATAGSGDAGSTSQPGPVALPSAAYSAGSRPASAGPAPSRPRDPHKKSRVRAIGVAVGLVVVAVAAALVTTFLNSSDDSGRNPAAPARNTTSATTTTEKKPETTTKSTTATTPPPATTTTQQQPPPQQQSASPAAAISDYYALMPGNLDQAWTRLTPRFQNGHAGGRSGFANWWADVNSVQVSGVTQTGGNTVEATVLYNFKDGHSQQEQTKYTLVNANGAWLIDAQDVLSSRTV